MINEALTCLTEEINEYFRNKLKVTEEKVILSGIVNQDGSVAIQGENKVVVTLVNIEQEPITKSNTLMGSRQGSGAIPPVKINLYILFSAYFTGTNYSESLRFLSFIIAFLQEKNVFSSSNTPRLDSSIDKISLEMVSLTTDKLNNLWASLGAKYMPSVLYKMRMLSFHSSNLKEYRPSIISATDENAQ
jgi:hypothetical protein